MEQPQLTNALLDVAALRFRLQQAKDTLAEHRAAFEAQQASLITEIQSLVDMLAGAESVVKDEALAHFDLTGEKKPCDGLEVKVFKRLDYDAAAAQEWAKAHPEKGLLVLDKKLYEKLSKNAIENGLPDWLDAPGKLIDEPRAQIAGDLTKVFGAEQVATATLHAIANEAWAKAEEAQS